MLGIAGLFALGSSSGAAPCSTTLGATDAGWYSASGFHDPNNDNYFVGYSAASATEYRDWFAFDLPAFTAPVAGATLRLAAFDVRLLSGSATVELHHVSTPLATLTNGGAGLANVFTDLGDGAVFGTTIVTAGQANAFISIPLNSNALSVISSNSGGRFAIGGRLASFLPGTTNDHTLFGYSYNPQANVQLTLAFGSVTAPVFLSQPPADYLLEAGDFARIDVTACGAAPLLYRWFFNGALLPGQTSSTLAINDVATTNTGDYFVVVSNPFGAITSSVTRMVVNARAATIESLTYDGQVLLGDTIRMSVQAKGTPPPAYRWSYNGIPLPNATNRDLRIPNAQFAYSGDYSITVTNAYGSDTRNIRIDVLPFILSGPYDTELALGEDGFLFSAVTSAFTMAFQWRYNGTNIPGANTAALPLFNASPPNAGSYDLVASGGGYAQTSRVAQVTVAGMPPHLTWRQFSTGFEGNSALLEHFVSGSPPIHLQWYFNGMLRPGATNAYLAFEHASTNDAGFYMMTASNAFGVASHQLQLVVVPQTAFVPGPVLERRGHVSENILLTSDIRGGPEPVHQWQLNGTNIPGATNASLMLSNVSLEQSGAYFCLGTNIHGAQTAQVSLAVLPRRALDRWTPREQAPHANDLEHIAFHNGRYVAVGEGGSIVTSTNAMDWTAIELGNRFTALGLAAGNGRFAALIVESVNLEDGNYFVLTSSDGSAWTPNVIPGLARMSAISFDNGAFEVWGASSSALPRRAYSSNGALWQSDIVTGLDWTPRTAAHGAGFAVLAAYGRIFASTDGTHFTPEPAAAAFFDRLRYANGVFVAVGAAGAIFTSSDAQEWQPRYSGTLETLHGITYGNGRFLAVGENGTVLVSTDNGTTWASTNAGVAQSLNDVLFDGTRFVACGDDGALLTSTDGAVWANHRQGLQPNFKAVVSTNGSFIAVGNNGNILTSSNGVDWSQQLSPTTRNLNAVAYGANQFVAVGDETILTSFDGVAWTNRVSPPTTSLQSICYGLGRFVAAGSPATMVSSLDGINWTLHTLSLPPNAELHGLAFGQGRFCAVGGYLETDDTPHPLILASTNGTAWTDVSSNYQTLFLPARILRGVAFGRTNFLAVGDGGTWVHFDANGPLLSSVTPSGKDLQQVRFAAGRFVILGSDGEISSSASPGDWNEHFSITSENLHDVALGANTFVVVGDAGTIVQSSEALPVFSAPSVSAGALQFQLRGGIEPQFHVQSSPDLISWTNIAVFTNNGTAVPFVLNTNGTWQFYRAASPPP